MTKDELSSRLPPESRWTVIAFAGKRGKVPYWSCECVCGTKQDVCQWNLTGGKTLSCGCLQRELASDDLTGREFDRLTVERHAGKHANGTHSVYLCRCWCGNRKVVMGQSLVSRATRSCGCLHKEAVSLPLKDRQFDRLTAVRVVKTDSAGRRYWLCVCACGNEKRVRASHLEDGSVTSCGCKVRTRDGQSTSKAMRAYYSRVRRDRQSVYDIIWTAAMDAALRAFRPFCVLCGTADDLTVDHVRPLSKGFGLEPGNACLLCGSCNNGIGRFQDDPDLLEQAAEYLRCS